MRICHVTEADQSAGLIKCVVWKEQKVTLVIQINSILRRLCEKGFSPQELGAIMASLVVSPGPEDLGVPVQGTVGRKCRRQRDGSLSVD